jgi:hypothetical protein
VLECSGGEGRSTALLHSRSVPGDELNFQSLRPTFAATTNLQHFGHALPCRMRETVALTIQFLRWLMRYLHRCSTRAQRRRSGRSDTASKENVSDPIIYMELQHDVQAKTLEAPERDCSTRQTPMADHAPLHPILQLQRSIGNQAVQRLLTHRGKTLQAKLMVGAAHDTYEQEAERVAEKVASMPAPVPPVNDRVSLQGRTREGDQVAQMKPLAQTITPVVRRSASDTLGSFHPGADFEAGLSSIGDGSPLPARTRAFMEPRFGADFSAVRLHTDSEAAQLNRAISGQAFTQGQDIYLGEGKDRFESSTGKHLLAHELTHTIQQGAAGALDPTMQRARLSEVGDGLIQRDANDPTPSTGAGAGAPSLGQLYNAAVQAARQTGNWQEAAERLNGFNREDIEARLAQLAPEEVKSIHQGALEIPGSGQAPKSRK